MIQLALAFKDGWREHSELCIRAFDTEGRRQDKSGGMTVDSNRLRNGTSRSISPKPLGFVP